MVDVSVSTKPPGRPPRRPCSPPGRVMALLAAGALPKGDALAVARVAGIMAAKKTPELIPLCHPLPIAKVTVDFDLGADP